MYSLKYFRYALFLSTLFILCGWSRLETAIPTKIVFASNRDGDYEIYVMNSDGGDPQQLTNNTTDDLWPTWSADNTQIAFTSYLLKSPQIFKMNVDGSHLTNLTPGEVGYQPSWSPTGNKIAYVSEDSSYGTSIYVMNEDGNEKFKLVDSQSFNVTPAWSPDGSKIIFMTTREYPPKPAIEPTAYDLYMVDIDGSNEHKVTEAGLNVSRPAWSPDGKRIAYSILLPPLGVDIITVHPDGLDKVSITGESFDNYFGGEEPTWSPDSEKIAFVGAEDEIFVINADGTDPVNMTNDTNSDITPAWQNIDTSLQIVPAPVVETPQLTSAIHAVAWSPDGKMIAGGGEEGFLRIWDATDANKVLNLTGISGEIYSVAWSPDSTKLASAGEDKIIRIWDATTGSLISTLQGHNARIVSVAWSPDGTKLASASYEETLTLRTWNAITYIPIASLQAGELFGVTWNPSGTKIGALNVNVGALVLDPSLDVVIQDLINYQVGPYARTATVAAATAMAWRPDGNEIVVGTLDGKIYIWNAITDRQLMVIQGHIRAIDTLNWSPNGNKIVSADESTIKFWNATTGELLSTIEKDPVLTLSISFSPDGTQLVYGDADGTLHIIPRQLDEQHSKQK